MARGLLNRSLSAVGRNPRLRRLQYSMIDRAVNRWMPALTLRNSRQYKAIVSDRFLLNPARKQKARLFLPTGSAPPAGWPVALGWHGGGWAMGHPDNLSHVAAALASQGIATLLADYRLSPAHHWPAQLEDVTSAFAWLANQQDQPLDCQKLAVFGDSAGGHLSACALTMLDLPIKAAVLYYGVYDFARMAAWNHPMSNDMLRALFGRDWRDPARLRQASPLFHIKKHPANLLVLAGDKDPLLRQNQRFATAWQQAGNQAELSVYQGNHHGFVNLLWGTTGHRALAQTTAFLSRNI